LESLLPFIDAFDVYVMQGDHLLVTKSIDVDTTFNKREIRARRLVLPIAVGTLSPVRVYVRIAPDQYNVVDGSMRLWTPRQFVATLQTEELLWGMFYGGMVLIMLYNLFIFVTIRDGAYLAYVVYQATISLAWMATTGHGSLYWWPDSVYLKQTAPLLFTALTAVASAHVSRLFLGTPTLRGRDDCILLTAGSFGVALMVATLLQFDLLVNILIWNVSLVPLIYIYVGVRVLRAGFVPARFFLTAWGFLLAGTAIYGLLGSGVIPYSPLAEYAGPLGVWLEAAFLSFALADRIRALRMEKDIAESKLIQAQIEPHFLFNTLANISSLIDVNVARAKDMLGKLDNYLRTILTRTRAGDTTLAQEISLLEAYLAIMQIRMGERLIFRIEIPDALRACKLPPLLLQPLVENALRHGLEPKPGGGEIIIDGKRVQDNLVLEVRDNGVGLAQHWRAGTGLSNVRERVRRLYGAKGKLEIMQNSTSGALFRLVLPLTADRVIDTAAE
ncbi:MAG: histidine kinase, partial [Gammaproteobacteria bacterium]|nr:histidine kinase [Gammaproteobacteria bacterium]